VNATEYLSVGFNAMSNDAAVAMRARRRQRVYRALEAVEGVVLSRNHYVESLVIFVFANFASSHTRISRAVRFLAVMN
jgi:hypothetical protein